MFLSCLEPDKVGFRDVSGTLPPTSGVVKWRLWFLKYLASARRTSAQRSARHDKNTQRIMNIEPTRNLFFSGVFLSDSYLWFSAVPRAFQVLLAFQCLGLVQLECFLRYLAIPLLWQRKFQKCHVFMRNLALTGMRRSRKRMTVTTVVYMRVSIRIEE